MKITEEQLQAVKESLNAGMSLMLEMMKNGVGDTEGWKTCEFILEGITKDMLEVLSLWAQEDLVDNPLAQRVIDHNNRRIRDLEAWASIIVTEDESFNAALVAMIKSMVEASEQFQTTSDFETHYNSVTEELGEMAVSKEQFQKTMESFADHVITQYQPH